MSLKFSFTEEEEKILETSKEENKEIEENEEEDTGIKLFKDSLFKTLNSTSNISLLSISSNQSFERTEHEIMRKLSNLPSVILKKEEE